MRIKAVITGAVLAAMAMASTALTLGRARGAAWIGQPLDLVISVQLDPGQTDTNVCPEAEVFHGDSRLDSSRVRVVVEPVKDTDTVNLRVISSTLIDEPVVTVYLRAGCTQRVARRFVMLADFPPETSASRNVTPVAPVVPLVVAADNPPAAPPQATNAVATTAPAANSMNVGATSAPASANQPAIAATPGTTNATASTAAPGGQTTNSAATERPAPPATKPSPRVAPAPKAVAATEAAPTIAVAPPTPTSATTAPTPAPAKSAASAPASTRSATTPSSAKAPAKSTTAQASNAGKSRLKLDPLDSAPAKPAEPAAEAANADKTASAPDTKHMEELQASVKTLLEQSAKNEATLLALRERLEKAETERVSMGVVYALIAVLVTALGGLLYVWKRRQQTWRDDLDDEVPGVVSRPSPAVSNQLDHEADAGISVQHLESRQ